MVISENYIPERGDLVWLNFQPQIGKEQQGRRPALVVSNSSYNKIVNLAVLCPITSKIKGFPFEVELPNKLPVNGAILVDQVKNLDWTKRDIEYIGKLPDQVMDVVISNIVKLIDH